MLQSFKEAVASILNCVWMLIALISAWVFVGIVFVVNTILRHPTIIPLSIIAYILAKKL